MNYDTWKATERDDTPWQECADCRRRDAETRMWIVDGRWLCDSCAADDLCERQPDTFTGAPR